MVARSLPTNSSIRESVILLTTLPASKETPEQKKERKEAYFANIYRRLESIVTKLFDRTDNLLDAPGNLSREAIIKNLIETDRQLIPAAWYTHNIRMSDMRIGTNLWRRTRYRLLVA